MKILYQLAPMLKGFLWDSLKENMLKEKECSITYKFNSLDAPSNQGICDKFYPVILVFLCPNHYIFSHFLKEEFKCGQNSEELSCFQALLLECF